MKDRLVRSWFALVVPILILAPVLGATRAAATFPGSNGLIAFSSAKAGHFGIWTVHADGSSLTELMPTQGLPGGLAFSPNGKKIAFDRGGLHTDLWVMRADGTGAHRITFGPADDTEPTWSPDGTRIAFERNGNLWIKNLLTHQARQVATGPAHLPDWSPSDCSIAFGRGGDLWTIAPDGAGLTRLTHTSNLFESSPSWSPDGGQIVFGVVDASREIYVRVMNADGSNQVTLTVPSSSVTSYAPVWSPDGSSIAFAQGVPFGDSHLWVMNANGTNPVRITSGPTFIGTLGWQSA
ncbi:MAG: TolB protein [Actinomycetota bacterium]|nr:TolB protein [Actinomycetota bacterium]